MSATDPALDILTTACPDLAKYGHAYDWEIVLPGDGGEEPRIGAIGRCGALDRARAAVEEALAELPTGRDAAAHVELVNIFDTDVARRTVGIAVRVADCVRWSDS